MQTFQIERKPDDASQKRIKAQGREFRRERDEEIDRRKQKAEQPVRDDAKKTRFFWNGDQADQIVQRAARRSRENTDKEGVKLTHRKSRPTLPPAAR